MYEINLDPRLKTIVREADAISKLGFAIPQDTMFVLEQSPSIFAAAEKIKYILREYTLNTHDSKRLSMRPCFALLCKLCIAASKRGSLF